MNWLPSSLLWLLLFAGGVSAAVLSWSTRASGRKIARAVELASLVAAVAVALWQVVSFSGVSGSSYGLGWNDFSRLVGLVVVIAAGASIVATRLDAMRQGEFGLVLLSAAAAVVAVEAEDMLGQVGLLLALQAPLWAVAYRNGHLSKEAVLKAMLVTTLAAMFAAAGAALWFARAGTCQVGQLRQVLAMHPEVADGLGLAGLSLWLAGMLAMVAAVPLHMWWVDAFDAFAPHAVMPFATIAPIAGLAVMSRTLLVAFGSLAGSTRPATMGWADVVLAVGLAGMLVVAAAALGQQRLRRLAGLMLVGQSGFVLVALSVAGHLAGNAGQVTASAALVYVLLIHGLSALTVAAAVAAVESSSGVGVNMEDLHGLASTHPLLALSIGVGMLSCAGMPPTGGFLARWLVLEGMVGVGWLGSAVIAALSVGLQLVLVLAVVVAMFRREPSTIEGSDVSGTLRLLSAVGVFALVAAGVVPGALLEWCTQAVARFW